MTTGAAGEHRGWIGVDLDGTLAKYHGWPADGSVGDPIQPMVDRVKRWVASGQQVKILTARAARYKPNALGQPDAAPELDGEQVTIIQEWCAKHIGTVLPVQFWKDYAMISLWDDRCVQVAPNTGLPLVDVDERNGTILIRMPR